MGEEAITYAISECDAVAVFTTRSLLSKIAMVIKNCPKIKDIIYYSDLHEKSNEKNFPSDKIEEEFKKYDRKIYSFEKLLKLGNLNGKLLKFLIYNNL